MDPRVLQVWLRRHWLAGLSDHVRAHVAEYRAAGPGGLLAAIPVLWPEAPGARAGRLWNLLDAAAAALGDLEARWCLCGALAAIVHGSWRPSASVDIALGDAAATPALLEALGRHRFRPRLVEASQLGDRAADILVFEHQPTGGPLHLIVAGPLEEVLLAGAGTRVVAGVAIPVASAAEVVAVKLGRRRAKDIDDAATILAAQGERLAVDQLESAARRCERALGRGDLLPLLHQMLPVRRAGAMVLVGRARSCYHRSMDHDAVRAYAGRRWGAAADADRRYWAERHRAEGPAATVAAAQELWRHMRELRPEWPDARDRESDLQHHVSLKRLLERCRGAVGAR